MKSLLAILTIVSVAGAVASKWLAIASLVGWLLGLLGAISAFSGWWFIGFAISYILCYFLVHINTYFMESL